MAKDWSLDLRPGSLALWGTPYTINVDECPAAVFQKQTAFIGVWEVKLDFAANENEEAGIVVWWSRSAYASLTKVSSDDGPKMKAKWRDVGLEDFSVRLLRRGTRTGSLTLPDRVVPSERRRRADSSDRSYPDPLRAFVSGERWTVRLGERYPCRLYHPQIPRRLCSERWHALRSIRSGYESVALPHTCFLPRCQVDSRAGRRSVVDGNVRARSGGSPSMRPRIESVPRMWSRITVLDGLSDPQPHEMHYIVTSLYSRLPSTHALKSASLRSLTF